MARAVRLLRSLDGPISVQYGYDRGVPVDRPHIEGFLERHADAIRGRVLEVKDAAYAHRFGGERVTAVDVVDIDSTNVDATIVADLSEPGSLPVATYDCIILTQVLEFLRPDALPNLYGALRPGGTLLISMPVLCRLEAPPLDLWRLTASGLEAALRRELPDAVIETEQHGNVTVAVAFLLGLAVEDLDDDAYRVEDDCFPVVSLAAVRRPV